MNHPYVLPVDPAGTEGRRWRCEACGVVGRLGEIGKIDCARPNAEVRYADPLDAVLAGKERSTSS